MGFGEATRSVRAYLGLLNVAGLAVHRDLAREEVLRRLPLECGSDANLVVCIGLQHLPSLRRTGMGSVIVAGYSSNTGTTGSSYRATL